MPLIESGDITELEREVIVETILGLAKKNYNLRKVCRVIQMPELHAKIRIATSMSGTPKVEEGVEAPLKSQSYTSVTFDLWKNVVHFAITKEAELKSSVDVWRMHAEDAARELAKMENDQIAAEMLNASTISGSDWGVDTNDPLDDIMAAMAVIENSEQGFTADYIVMHPLVYADLVSNQNVRDALERGTVIRTGELATIAGLKILRDKSLDTTSAYVLDSNAPALVLGEGPEVSEEYTGKGSFVRGIAIAKFIQPKLLQSGAIRRITGVHS